MERLKKRREDLLHKLGNFKDKYCDEFLEARKNLDFLNSIYEAQVEIEGVSKTIHEIEILKKEASGHVDFLKELEEEKICLQKKSEKLKEGLYRLLIPPMQVDSTKVVMEIRAAAGGSEAAIFVGDLCTFYENYCSRKNLNLKVLNSTPSLHGGYRDLTLHVAGYNAFGSFKYEAGVHRVQRVPTTGRLLLLIIVNIGKGVCTLLLLLLRGSRKRIDLRIDTFKASGPGGQAVNTTDSAVRITHLPTGLVVQCQDERSQNLNKESALKVLRLRLYQQEQERIRKERSQLYKSQVGQGERNEKVRTYNFQHDRLCDHRVNFSITLRDALENGKLEEIYQKLHEKERLEYLCSL
ncbi:LOW QUALITY PROTEIN: peptide chain release factor 1-like [Zophobas morio]|uniref:LOW QUALITY PROTEIN: peptide chain release factor 1-like n=1 Tax=Zophobas morio TaxID=2755281 RepID=UPI003082B289